jgi:MerR family transcriptional regulator, light-induced transcriptional regulator
MDRECDTRGPSKRPFSSEQINWLISAVEHSIVPRLLHSANLHHPRHNLTESEAEIAVTEFVKLIVTNQGDQAVALIQALELRGATVQDIYLGVLAPVAKRLGVLWEEDDADFTQVTLGMWRLHQIMHDLSAKFQREGSAQRDTHSHLKHEAILVPVPGSQHTLGLLMVVEFFRREGWSVWGEPQLSLPELIAAVKRKNFDLIGLSISTADQLEVLKETIQKVRASSMNTKIHVMVGGPLIVAQPELAAQVGAIATAPDAPTAVAVANQLVSRRF